MIYTGSCECCEEDEAPCPVSADITNSNARLPDFSPSWADFISRFANPPILRPITQTAVCFFKFVAVTCSSGIGARPHHGRKQPRGCFDRGWDSAIYECSSSSSHIGKARGFKNTSSYTRYFEALSYLTRHARALQARVRLRSAHFDGRASAWRYTTFR